MRFVQYSIRNLSKEQRDVVDCHQITKNRYLHTGEAENSIEYSNKRKYQNLGVLPKEESFKHTRYFSTDSPLFQSWQRPIHYHCIGTVEFLSTITYCDRETKSLLESAGFTTKPIIHHRYIDRRGALKPVSQVWVSEIALKLRQERKARRARIEIEGGDNWDSTQSGTDSTEDSEASESDMEESPAVIENSENTESDIASATSEKTSATEQVQPQEEKEELQEPTGNEVKYLDPEDYVTQDEETYAHYKETTEKKIKTEESDTEGEV